MLTARQREVLTLAADGYSAAEIGRRLGISEAGVKKHLELLRRRFNVRNTTALVRAVIVSGELEQTEGQKQPTTGAKEGGKDRDRVVDLDRRIVKRDEQKENQQGESSWGNEQKQGDDTPSRGSYGC